MYKKLPNYTCCLTFPEIHHTSEKRLFNTASNVRGLFMQKGDINRRYAIDDSVDNLL